MADARLPVGDDTRVFVLVLAVQTILLAGRQIAFGEIFADHAFGVEARHDGRHRTLGHLQPIGRETHLAVFVVQRHNLVLQQFVQGAGFLAGAYFFAQRFRYRLDCPAVFAVVALSPPAVQHGQGDGTVHSRFHAGGTARLHWIQRIVQPHITTGNQLARQGKIITFHNQYLADELRHFGYLGDAPNQILPRNIRRMRLAGKNEYDRAIRIIQYLAQPIEVAEQHGRALVSRKTARKTDRKDIGVLRIDVFEQAIQVRLRTMVAEVLRADAFAHHVQHLGLERLAHTPEQVVRNAVNAFPELHVIHACAPFQPEMALQYLDPLSRQKGRRMYAIGDISHRVFAVFDFRPHVSANRTR